MARIPPKNPITRFLNRIPFSGLWFDWFGGSPLQKWRACFILTLCALALLTWDVVWPAAVFVAKELSSEVVMDAIKQLLP